MPLATKSVDERTEAGIMLTRTLASVRGCTPLHMQREIERLDLHEAWGAMLTRDKFWPRGLT